VILVELPKNNSPFATTPTFSATTLWEQEIERCFSRMFPALARLSFWKTQC
jgi:hypothetical protein